MICLWLSLAALPGLARGALAEPAANVVFATGSASIVAADGVRRKAERGSALLAGEMVDTQDGKAQLRFRDGAAISLQPGTQFRIEQYRFVEQDGRASENDSVVMRFLKGTLRAISGLIGRQKREQYRMDTPVGTIGIRGTEYGAEMSDDGLSVTTYSGLVEVCNPTGCAQVGVGQTLIVTDGNSRPRLRSVGNHPSLQPGEVVPQLPDPARTPLPTTPQQQMPSQTQPYTPPSMYEPNY